jgi:NAD(P)H-hydrate epimerase
MTPSPPPLPRAAIRELDRRAIEEYGIPGIVLMENAAMGCDRVLSEIRDADPSRFGPPYVIFCGPGNNGGDGFALARHLRNRGLAVEVRLIEPRGRVRAGSDAAVNLAVIDRMGIPVIEPGDGPPDQGGVAGPGTIVDAMLGTGLDRPLRSPYLERVRALNGSGRGGSGKGIVAIDIPTGLDADSGEILGEAVRADHTITMAAPKLGFCKGAGPACAGTVHVVGIGISL